MRRSLRIAFIDSIEWDYVIHSPRSRPLGGSQSALCYLAEALVKLGHDVTLFNHTTRPGRSRGVNCFTLTDTHLIEFSYFDVLIALNTGSAHLAKYLRAGAGDSPLMVCWSQHNHDQPAVEELAQQSAHDAWDGFVLVSEWQARGYREVFGIQSERIKIIGNAVSPPFENLYAHPETMAAQKPWPPVLCYTSTPFRGLDVLLDAFPLIRAAIPGATLKVYSSLGVYQVGADEDPYAPLYERCRAMEGVEYIGSVPQTLLAGELKHATCLAYPNTFAEGFCISVLEAMAAGCLVITSDLGALRTTTAGFGHHLAPPVDETQHAALYADFAVRVLQQARSSPAEHAQRLADQVRTVHQTGTWAVRAREWSDWLTAEVARRSGG